MDMLTTRRGLVAINLNLHNSGRGALQGMLRFCVAARRWSERSCSTKLSQHRVAFASGGGGGF